MASSIDRNSAIMSLPWVHFFPWAITIPVGISNLQHNTPFSSPKKVYTCSPDSMQNRWQGNSWQNCPYYQQRDLWGDYELRFVWTNVLGDIWKYFFLILAEMQPNVSETCCSLSQAKSKIHELKDNMNKQQHLKLGGVSTIALSQITVVITHLYSQCSARPQH